MMRLLREEARAEGAATFSRGVAGKENRVDAARSRRIGSLELTPRAVLLLVAAALAALSVALVVAAQEPARASFPGKNGNIAFVAPDADGTSQIFKVSPAGGTPKQLTFDKTLKESPTWSADGRKIAFVRWGPRGADIYTMNADGSGKVAITSSRKNDYQPAWSPSGRRLVFSRDVGGETYPKNYDLFTVRSDGSHLVRLTRTAEREEGPAWSPDGTKIAFSIFIPIDYDGIGSIYTMKPDGSEAPSEVLRCGGCFVGDVSWSPDGQWFAYMQAYPRSGNSIFKVRADGTEPTFLTAGDGSAPLPDASSPEWSPDGTQIAFSSGSAIYKMDTDGNNVHSIVEGVGVAQPSWEPVP
jgi:Tol biopolymer transport system component